MAGSHSHHYLFEIVTFLENFNGSSEYSRTFAVYKEKGFEFYREIFGLGSLLVCRFHHDSAYKHSTVKIRGRWSFYLSSSKSAKFSEARLGSVSPSPYKFQ